MHTQMYFSILAATIKSYHGFKVDLMITPCSTNMSLISNCSSQLLSEIYVSLSCSPTYLQIALLFVSTGLLTALHLSCESYGLNESTFFSSNLWTRETHFICNIIFLWNNFTKDDRLGISQLLLIG